ncbi:cysteine-rich secretory protein 3-like [Aplysia californica]|uniref:Cysteine-rich secretory protein 3-like n=1 Tax=Aplysia californica TaxID=6500 RepID=A0ABM1W0H7_APLCA|nr:cysteine-rich secretory protein 3-like [Aplysia californica]
MSRPAHLALCVLLVVSWCSGQDHVLTVQDAREILDQHNDYRREEGAADMYLLHWNTSLQERANTWAHKCNFRHEHNIDVGENLFFDNDHKEKVLMRGLKAWFVEKELWSFAMPTCGDACHYTQVQVYLWWLTGALL